MGLSRILKSFSTISFTWFYLFIVLENAEAKIGESMQFLVVHFSFLSLHRLMLRTRCVTDKIVMCI
jgi:hypothetical protein